MLGFIIRLIGYVLLLGMSERIASSLWTRFGLDGFITLQPLHDEGIAVLLIAPLVLALIGFGQLRLVALFVGFGLAGAALTAPFVLVRVTGG
ncbi:MAG TPA: hypothetical protein VMA36_18500 [Candidatus Limnocylindria bacterium]|jgi:hypothetical protein|nr:hypothetical protein [Candidatus Limnocylindria bacterium]